jgi:Uncharacterized protein family UPF0004
VSRKIADNIHMPKKETVGCQMNVLDSELVVGSLRRHGYSVIHDWDDADLILSSRRLRSKCRHHGDRP